MDNKPGAGAAKASRSGAKRLPRDKRVAAIMHMARAVLRERGSEQFLPSEVAERCGISEGTIYKYFATKRDLLLRVAEEWFEEFLAEQHPVGSQTSIYDRLLQVVRSSLALVRRERALTRFVLIELRADPAYRSTRVYELNRRIAGQATKVLEAGVRSGALRSDVSVKLARDLIFGAIEHQTWAYLRGEGDFSVEDSARGITDVVYRGLVARREEAEEKPTPGRFEALTQRLEDAVQRLDRLVAPPVR